MIRNIIRALLPSWLRDRRASFLDVRGFFSVRRQFASNSVVTDILACIRSACWPKKTILFFPERPPKTSVDYKLCALLGYAITTNPRRRFDVAFKRRDVTFFDQATLQMIPTAMKAIVNAGSIDISKRNIAGVFSGVFGYALEVDPIRHAGDIVEKSDKNATHDGRIVTGPVSSQEIKSECVYQKAIDNSSDANGMMLDHRVVVHGEQIVLVYLKYRPVEKRFSNTNAYVKLEEPKSVFSSTELENIIVLARKLGVDYGELDVLRDRQDGRIYIVDVNNTPWGPPNGLPAQECKIALERLIRSFDVLLEQRSPTLW